MAVSKMLLLKDYHFLGSTSELHNDRAPIFLDKLSVQFAKSSLDSNVSFVPTDFSP